MALALQIFLNTLATIGGAVAAIGIGIVALTIFFKIVFWFSDSDDSTPTNFDRDALVDATVATVHLQGGRTFENVRVSGLVQGYGYEPSGMVVIEDEAGNRYHVHQRTIRMIVVPAPVPDEARDEVDSSRTA